MFCKSVVESAMSSVVICWGNGIGELKQETEQTDNEGWLCSGDGSGTSGADVLHKMNKIMDTLNIHSDSATVSSVRGFFRFTATQTATGDPSCPQQ